MDTKKRIAKGLVFGIILLFAGTGLNALTIITTANTGGPDYYGYIYIDSNEPNGPIYNWIDITATGTYPSALTNSDDHYVNGIPIGFTFNFYGQNYTQLSITNNGILPLSGGTSQYINEPIGESIPDNLILPYWDDLVTWGTPPTGIFYETLGTAPQRMFVVEWQNNQHYHNSPSGITFEVILYEGSNDIKFQYQNVTFGDGINDYGASATVGIEGPTGQGLQYSCNQSMSITNNLAILTVLDIPPVANFTYTPTNPTNTTNIYFYDTSFDYDGTIVSWWWDFKDGTYSDQQNPVHLYYTDGIFNVTLTVTDNDGSTNTTQKTVVVYTPPPNQPPNVPTNPLPPNEATDVSITTNLNWTGGDPDTNDTVLYDVYFGTTNPPPKVIENQSETSYDLPTLSYHTQYYWKIIAWDNHGEWTSGPIWTFLTMSAPNNPPYIPNNPSPANSTHNVSISTDLSWSGGDPDPDDTVRYDVYFGTTNPPIKIVSNQSGTSYDIGTMTYGTPYYWKIISWDNHNVSASGPLWNFHTESQPDQTPPTVTITSPQKNYFYVNFKDIITFRFPFITTFVIGKIDIAVQATDTQSGIDRVEFYIDNILQANDTITPYSWTWSEQVTLFPYVVKVTAYDKAGNHESDEMNVWKIF